MIAVQDQVGRPSRAPIGRKINHRRAALERAIEQAIAALDALDGDADHELECEDEGGQCDDEGAVEEDYDRSDYEHSLCGITFGRGVEA